MVKPMTDPLARIARARKRQEHARQRLLTALEDAIAAGLTHRQVAEAAGVSRVTLWRWLGELDGPKEKAPATSATPGSTTHEEVTREQQESY